MRSRAFFFTAMALIGVIFVIGVNTLWQNRSRIVDGSSTQEQVNIRMNKTVTGTVTEVMTSANIVTIREASGQETHIAIVSETKLLDEKNKTATINAIYKESTIEAKGEATATNAMLAGEVRIVSTPSLIITSPTEHDPVHSPLSITGLATGPWYFEATFPVTITDADHRSLGQHYVTATEDWMSESLVPFTATVEFAQPKTKTGYLIFKNANPSGLPEHEKTFEMPIVFETDTANVKVFFNNSKLDPAFLCTKVFPTTRAIPWTEGIGRAAIEELFKGPTAEEKAMDYFTNINPNVRINSLTIENGTARVDLSDELDRNVGGSCRVTAIRAQITETLKQFPTVQQVVISINGKTEDILQP